MQGWEGWEKWEEGIPPLQPVWCRGRGRNFAAIYTDVVREGGGSADGFHLPINKHASHLRTQGCQSPDPSSPSSRGAGKAAIEIGMLGDWNGFFSRNPTLPQNGESFLKVGRAEVGRKKMKFPGHLPPENL